MNYTTSIIYKAVSLQNIYLHIIKLGKPVVNSLFINNKLHLAYKAIIYKLEIVFTRAAPAFHNLFMGCVFNINTVHKTVEKLTF